MNQLMSIEKIGFIDTIGSFMKEKYLTNKENYPSQLDEVREYYELK
jgi:hypothetical protein